MALDAGRRTAPRVRMGRTALVAALAMLGAAAPGLASASGSPRSVHAPAVHLPPLPTPLVGSRPVALHSTKPPYTGSLSVPELVWPGHEAVAARVDGVIDAWVASEVRAFAGQVTQDLLHAKNLPASLPASQLTISFHVAELNARVASFRLVLEPYVRGEASPAQIPAGLTFNLATGAPYSLPSLFRAGTGYLPVLARLATKGLQGFHPAGAHCYVGPGGPSASAKIFSAWSLAPGGLELAFPAGQYTAAYCGPPVITVPLGALRALAAPDSPLARQGAPGVDRR